MADRFFGTAIVGIDTVSIEVMLRSAVDTTPMLNIASTAITAYYYRQGAASPTQIPVVALASASAAWLLGGWFQISATNYSGRYRLDVPDAMFAAGSPTPDWVGLQVKTTGSLPYDAAWVLQRPSLAADHWLLRDWTGITATVPSRCGLQALRLLRNKWEVNPSTAVLTVRREDDITEAWNAGVSTSAGADPITGVDPA